MTANTVNHAVGSEYQLVNTRKTLFRHRRDSKLWLCSSCQLSNMKIILLSLRPVSGGILTLHQPSMFRHRKDPPGLDLSHISKKFEFNVLRRGTFVVMEKMKFGIEMKRLASFCSVLHGFQWDHHSLSAIIKNFPLISM